jgi:hypothetical protein
LAILPGRLFWNSESRNWVGLSRTNRALTRMYRNQFRKRVRGF